MLKKILINSAKLFGILFILVLSITFISNGIVDSKSDDVYADSNIALENEFSAPLITNKAANSERLYKDLDFTATVKNFDKRVYVLDYYFAMNDSPLYGQAKLFTEACNKFNAPKDCTTVAAIAMNETHLCKYLTSAERFNCWGYGGPGIHRVTFKSWQDGIDRVTDVLANQYGAKFMIDPSLMEGTFCGKQDECIGWGKGIKQFMNQINDLSKNLGMGDLFSLR